MENPRNPFILGHRIERPYFCDRFDEQKRLTSALVNGRNMVLISPRRMGKTSLIYVSLNDCPEIRDEYLTFFIDILETNSLSEFTYLLGKAVFDTLLSKSASRLREFLATLRSLRGSFGFDSLTGTPTFNIQLGDIKHPEYTLDEIFRFIEESGKPMIIVIDEFQQITKYPEKNTEAVLRGHTQRLSNASFVFAGSERTILQEMFVSSKRPFYNSSEIMHLGPIAGDTYIAFAKEMFRERGKDLEEAPLRWAFDIFEGNTFYMQRTMNGAFAETPVGGRCGEAEVLQSVREMLSSSEVVYREMLSNVGAVQKETLYAVARNRTVRNPLSGEFLKRHALRSASSVQSALQKLTRAGLVQKGPEGYSLTDPLLRIFINNLYGLPEL